MESEHYNDYNIDNPYYLDEDIEDNDKLRDYMILLAFVFAVQVSLMGLLCILMY